MTRRHWLYLTCLLLIAPAGVAESAEQVELLIVAGQSNAVGYDAKPSELPKNDADRNVLFWWRCGDPPPDTHDSSSGGKWTHLQPQPLGNPKRPRKNRQYGNFAQKEGGFGPEIGLARAIYATEKKRLAVIKVAFSGTGVHRDWNHADKGDGGACYRTLVSEVRKAMASAGKRGIELRPRALAWVQGESDANANDAPQYARRLRDMIAALRRDLQTPELSALIAVNTRFGGGRNRFMPTIVEQQKRVAATDPRCEYVDTSSATIANRAHFDSKGTLLVGRLFAESLFNLERRLNAKQRSFTIVTLGDSITKGVRPGVKREQTFASLVAAKLKKSGRDVEVTNVGVGGERTDQALKRLSRIIALRPDIVAVMYGTNDSYVDRGKKTSRLTIKQYRDNLNRIIVELLRRGITPVLMTEPRWADDAGPNGIGEHPNVRLEKYVAVCRETAKRWRVPLVDHFADWTTRRKNGTKLRSLTTDGCHPNPAGHAKLAVAMLPVLQSTIGPELRARKKLMTDGKLSVVCFGDSVTGVYYHTGSRRAYTDMLGIALQRIAPRAKVEMINAGISGHTTVNALARIDRDVLRHKPDVVTVMFGLNDMTRVPLKQYRANLKKIVKKCRDTGAEVILATPNNVTDTPRRPTNKLIEYCDVVRAVGRELKTPVFDVYRELDAVRSHDAFDWHLLMSDAIHPNMDGHQRLATALAQTLTGLRVTLDDVGPPTPLLSRVRARIKHKQPIRVLAMPPFDRSVADAIRKSAPDAKVKVETWSIAKMNLAGIENDAKSRVRKIKPDLVVIAVPRSAKADRREAFVKSYAWIMNWSLNFGKPTWDVVVVHPDVANLSANPTTNDDLVRRLVRAQDLPLIDRRKGNKDPAAKVFAAWINAAMNRK